LSARKTLHVAQRAQTGGEFGQMINARVQTAGFFVFAVQ